MRNSIGDKKPPFGYGFIVIFFKSIGRAILVIINILLPKKHNLSIPSWLEYDDMDILYDKKDENPELFYTYDERGNKPYPVFMHKNKKSDYETEQIKNTKLIYIYIYYVIFLYLVLSTFKDRGLGLAEILGIFVFIASIMFAIKKIFFKSSFELVKYIEKHKIFIVLPSFIIIYYVFAQYNGNYSQNNRINFFTDFLTSIVHLFSK